LGDEHLVELNDRIDVRVIGHIAPQNLGVGQECRQEILGRIEQKMTRRDERRWRPGSCAAQAPLDRHAAETGVDTEKSNGHGHVRRDVVAKVKARAWSVRIENGDAHHGDSGSEFNYGCDLWGA